MDIPGAFRALGLTPARDFDHAWTIAMEIIRGLISAGQALTVLRCALYAYFKYNSVSRDAQKANFCGQKLVLFQPLVPARLTSIVQVGLHRWSQT